MYYINLPKLPQYFHPNIRCYLERRAFKNAKKKSTAGQVIAHFTLDRRNHISSFASFLLRRSSSEEIWRRIFCTKYSTVHFLQIIYKETRDTCFNKVESKLSGDWQLPQQGMPKVSMSLVTLGPPSSPPSNIPIFLPHFIFYTLNPKLAMQLLYCSTIGRHSC